jgi:hypothetical protein
VNGVPIPVTLCDLLPWATVPQLLHNIWPVPACKEGGGRVVSVAGIIASVPCPGVHYAMISTVTCAALPRTSCRACERLLSQFCH